MAEAADRARALCDAALADADDNDGNCVKCGNHYAIDEGACPSPYCHPCAQVALLDIAKMLRGLLDAAQGQDVRPEVADLKRLCDAVEAEASAASKAPWSVAPDHEELDHAHILDADGMEVARVEGEREDYDGSAAAADALNARLAGDSTFIALARSRVPALAAALREALDENGDLCDRLADAEISIGLRESTIAGLEQHVRDLELRAEVAEFARAMEERLKANDHKGGWRGEGALALIRRLYEEADELNAEIGSSTPDRTKILREAADVANFAMMVADECGALPALRGIGELS